MKQILNTMTLAALAGLASFTTFAGTAVAGTPEATVDERSRVVHFGDLDPALPADAATLLKRLDVAARRTCIRNDEGRQIFLSVEHKACIANGYADAIARINAKRNIDLQAIAARHEQGRNLNAAR
jgi:UrcA family protein